MQLYKVLHQLIDYWQVWSLILQRLGIPSTVLKHDTGYFSSWWAKAVKVLCKEKRKGLNSLIIFGCLENFET
uniref:Uncharacterized protein n=1 Tax=Oryza brachyantha TaxID=4533 RepID=J3MG27_ORYBR